MPQLSLSQSPKLTTNRQVYSRGAILISYDKRIVHQRDAHDALAGLISFDTISISVILYITFKQVD